ncbi:hypothetical protein [Chitinophaga sp. Cy-1792]|uniref:hypothetical protein n=1 Tax=Chitinophaga sp. Cy-1792 TaxID=2608339 RepID=UPI00141EFEBB|nr:hypothetical protein [Chitinophaga sp. Cy-1792]NIG54679.1 hypothetical protein [Chitinophaga sp. Cy-1792]
MIELITRQYVFDNYRKLTAQIINMQQSMFDADDLFETADDKQRYIEMHDAIDLVPADIIKHNSVITFDHDNINTFTAAIAEKLTKICTRLQISDLIVMAEVKQRFVGNPGNKFEPFQQAVSKFHHITRDLAYKEAFRLSLTDMPALIDIMFWIGRCDAGAPAFIFFCDTNEKMAFTLCQYGGIHVTAYEPDMITHDLLESTGMYFVEGRCEEEFSDSSKITGRVAGI